MPYIIITNLEVSEQPFSPYGYIQQDGGPPMAV